MIGRFLSLVAGLILLAAITGCGSASVPPSENTDNPGGVSMNGSGNGVSISPKWSVTGYILGPNSTWKDQDAQALLFKTLDITDTEINYDDQVCQGVTFQEQTVKPSDYLTTTWKITPQALSVDAPDMQVIKTNCNIPGFSEYMRVGIGRLIVPINGVFFFFDPMVAY